MSDFSCKDITFDVANSPERCVCKGAAMRAYGCMKVSGCAETEAVEAAYRVYRYHHPEDSKGDARLTVERWIYSEHAN